MFKIITGTFLATLFLMSVSAKLFLMPLLGLFDLAAVPVSQLAELNASKKMVKKMESRHKNLQKRHEVKKQRVTKKFVKNSTKKISSAAAGSVIPIPLAATSAVIVIVAGFEVMDYCEYQQELHEDEMILFDIDQPPFDLELCVEKGGKDMKTITDDIILKSKDRVAGYIDEADDFKDKKFDEFFEWSDSIIEYYK
jgi:hypothetical protein